VDTHESPEADAGTPASAGQPTARAEQQHAPAAQAGQRAARAGQEAEQTLASQQAALVAALVGGGPDPPGFDKTRLKATREALVRKRAGDVAAIWPRLAAAFGAQWTVRFAQWAAARPPAGALRDGFDLARALAEAGELPGIAAEELADMNARWRYDGTAAPHRRRFPGLYRLLARRI
jgi:hypothetical protein